MKLVHWPLMGGLLHLVQRGEDCAGPQPAQAPPRCTKCNNPPINGQCTNHCNSQLLCSFNVSIKWSKASLCAGVSPFITMLSASRPWITLCGIDWQFHASPTNFNDQERVQQLTGPRFPAIFLDR